MSEPLRLPTKLLLSAFALRTWGARIEAAVPEGSVAFLTAEEALANGDPSDAEAQPGGAEGQAEGALVMDGMMPVDELKARLALPDLPAEGSYHTLAGLVLALLRRVPRVGERIVFAGWRFEVLEMDGRRVEKVRASREPAAEA